MNPEHPAERSSQHARRPSKPPIRLSKDKRSRPSVDVSTATTRHRQHTTKNSVDITRLADEGEFIPHSPRLEDDPHAKYFRVANVGAGGRLYLQPSRPLATVSPQSPTFRSSGLPINVTESAGNPRQSIASTLRTVRLQECQDHVEDVAQMKPSGTTNTGKPQEARKMVRSNSFSCMSQRERLRASVLARNERRGDDGSNQPAGAFAVWSNGGNMDSKRGLLGLDIPHYRLGTPGFTELGTAYLRASVYTPSLDGRSSLVSLAPAPVTIPQEKSHMTGDSRARPCDYLSLPFSFATTTSQSGGPVSKQATATSIDAFFYDRLDENPNDPGLVRLNPITHSIVAATVGRLISEITSPHFLDYELLSDFFLTFRSFMLATDLLEHLLARLRWALMKATDACRIVRVRTFVALRHWILNYFADDFVPDQGLRRRFCDLVNNLTISVDQILDGDTTRKSIIGELKKCWRRTCASFWSIPDAVERSTDAQIWPGGVFNEARLSTTSNAEHSMSAGSMTDRTALPQRRAMAAVRQSYGRMLREDVMTSSLKRVSFPTSPMSEDSLQALSCSVPFLRNIGLATDTSESQAPRLLSQDKTPRTHIDKPTRASQQHQRGGSFNDALLDRRMPLSSGNIESTDFAELPTVAFTGGLIRGLLLKPSPSELNHLNGPALGVDDRMVRFVPTNDKLSRDKSPPTVKKLVGGVRRALSTRKAPIESAGHARSTHSSSSSNNSAHYASGELPRAEVSRPDPAMSRLDALGESATRFFNETADEQVENNDQVLLSTTGLFIDPRQLDMDLPAAFDSWPDTRLDSTYTAGSESILIMDATRDLSARRTLSSGPLNPWMRMNPRSQSMISGADSLSFHATAPETISPSTHQGRQATRRENASSAEPSNDGPNRQDMYLDGQMINKRDDARRMSARKSSSAYPDGVRVQSLQHALRRRPGGDLKAAEHVHELTPGLHREICDAIRENAVFTRDPSYIDSAFAPSPWLDNDHRESMTPYMALQGNYGPYALLDTHSSLHALRPSLEAQVSQFATFPDDYGGIEDALLKLEGRSPVDSSFTQHEMDPVLLSTERRETGATDRWIRIFGPGDADLSLSRQSKGTHSTATVVDSGPADGKLIYGNLMLHEPNGQRLRAHSLPTDVAAAAFRDFHRPHTLTQSSVWPVSSVQVGTGLDTYNSSTADMELPSQHDNVDWDFALKKSISGEDSDAQSDISTAMGDENVEMDVGLSHGNFFFRDASQADRFIKKIPPREQLPANKGSRTHTRSKTIAHPPRPESREFGHSKRELPSPTTGLDKSAGAAGFSFQSNFPSVIAPDQARRHLPFVLMFDAKVIAEQFTIIEKDALDEIDWKDLVGMRWRQHFPVVRNWANFLKLDGYSGIDFVVARFNLVVKWVISECVLTQAIHERAKTIARFIHIAVHCRRLRNYASMYQVTLALLSTDVTRLRRTWALVSAADKRSLLELETLCQPVRNFRSLRVEMESGHPDEGCIPFMGLYTHDLMYNAQKPMYIDVASSTQGPLINFERFQMAAMIIKGLLLLIEASSKYTFRPHPEALSRSLWLVALEDGEIAARSRAHEL